MSTALRCAHIFFIEIVLQCVYVKEYHYICKTKAQAFCCYILFIKRFCFILYSEIAKFHTRRVMQSQTPMLAYNHPRVGFYTGNAWDGLFISCKAFGDASNKINRTSSTLFCL